jgi:hypothetical protein
VRHEFCTSFFICVVEGDRKFRFTEKSLPENNKILLKLDVHKQPFFVASIKLRAKIAFSWEPYETA